ncbi:type II secretion system F family protein [Streptomyces sp. RFCAC02]|uniref:type II secretion system F family protein n=1 Tax=Streptomyces sp. RFCAC02 TaxID=2499143 RepID=UPI00101E9979|nr:type II secretion system F family protein [Streptomyces sp. RFCAC02]
MTALTAQLPHLTAALCVGAGAWLLADGPPSRRALLLGPVSGPPYGWRTRGTGLWRRRWARRSPPGGLDARERRLALGCVAAGMLLALWGRSVLPLPMGAALVPLAVRLRRRRADRRAADLRRKGVVTFCASLAGEVRAGHPPARALITAASDGLADEAEAVRAAAHYGGDIPEALRRAAERPGAEGLRGVVACWQVAVDGGASLAGGLEKVAETLRAEQAQREELRAQLAGPRATAFMLAVLPVLGILLGAALGVRPLEILLHTPLGLGCLLAGAALEWAGIAWVAAIVRRAERVAS